MVNHNDGTTVLNTPKSTGACFIAGTLVHTKDGLKPIEQIQVGDWVLSQPEDKGEQTYKRVVNTFSFDDKAVVKVRYRVQRNGEWQYDHLIVTGNHPFWVAGVDKSHYPDHESNWADFRLGWTRADELFSGVFIELATGEQAYVTSGNLDRLWKTEQPDVAWEAYADSEKGDLIWINNGQGVLIQNENNEFVFHPDFRDDDTFVDRLSDWALYEKWLYRCKVYNFEVEDFHTYYVGNLGAWVHNTNCYATTVAYLKKNGILPSIDGQAFFSVGQMNAMVKEMLGKVVTPRTVSEAGACFAAGTLVHTKDGLKPIEQIEVGDWVLSKPESGEGEQAYKRVARTFSFEDKVVRRVSYAIRRNGEWQTDNLIVTDNHPFWVAGFDEENYPDGYRWDAPQIGWTRADLLYFGLKIELPSGEYAYVQSSSIDRLWKTKHPETAWEAKVGDYQGFFTRIKHGEDVCLDSDLMINADFHEDETFRYREENPEWQEKWLYRCKVYNFEIEDFHTYYVGNLGAWVHNTNCYGTTVEYMKKH